MKPSCLLKRMFSNPWCLALALGLFPCGELFSRPKANADNVFISPTAEYAFWDVLKNDDPGDCLPYETLQMEIITPPHHALLCTVESNYIFYMPAGDGYSGADSLVYQITCDGQVSQAKVYINIKDQPDNVTLDVCHVPIPAIDFGIKELARSDSIVNVVSPILCGDIDNDGIVEILVLNATSEDGDSYPLSTAILVYNLITDEENENAELVLKYTIPIPEESVNPYDSYFSIASVDGDGYAAIFYVTKEGNSPRQLYKYRFDPVTKNYYSEWNVSYSGNPVYGYPSPLIADFMGSGNVHVQLYDKLFDARTGTLLVNGIDGKTIEEITDAMEYSFGRYGHAPSRYRRLSTCVAGDIDGDGILEIIGGDCVYKVNITNYAGTEGNSMTLYKRANSRSDVKDGATALVDLDLDGQLDVVVASPFYSTTYGSLYAYNPRTGEIMNDTPVTNIALPVNGNNAPSLLFVGDIDQDGKPEIAFVSAESPSPGNADHGILKTYKYDITACKFIPFWDIVNTDGSSSTTLSLFDFDQSGEAKLIYRDEDALQIIDGKDGTILAEFNPVGSATVNEYPIVADLTGKGSAQIITTGVDAKRTVEYPSAWNWRASLRVYSSSTEDWAPARKVWNQRAYNPLYVNEDLTIPRYPPSPATAFTSGDTITRPFNNFLQQATMLNDGGMMLYKAADLQFDPYKRPVLIVDDTADKLRVKIKVGNTGDKEFNPPLAVSLYVYESATDTYTHLNTTILQVSIPKAGTLDISYEIAGYSSLPFPAAYDSWCLFLNAADNAPSPPSFPHDGSEEECAYWNNRSANLSFTYGERIMCQGESEEVCLSPDGVYSYKWYDAATGGTLLAEGDSYTVTKDAAIVQRYFVDTYSKSTGAKLNAIRDTVYIYLTPDSLVWTGVEDSDWHNFANWRNPSVSGTDPYAQRNIPRKCTNVLVPDGLVRYPDLRDAAGSGTSYGEYAVAGCRYITFSHGGEVSRTDLLDYEGARVELTMNANRWYMLSAPLRSLYTGDFYEVDANPHLDNVEVYTRLYRTANPQTGETSTDEWGWSGVFHNPHYQMGPGRGVSFWLDNRQAMDVVTSHTFTFPKSEEYYHIYARAGHIHATVPLSRNGVQERFVYEGVQDASGNIPLEALCTESGGQLIVGNPFMGHWDFHRFYEANSAYIKNYYKVLTEHGTFETYTVTGAETGTGTGTPALSRYIAPMQSVLVESRVPFSTGTLQAHATQVTNNAGSKLRGTGAENIKPQVLTLEVSRGSQKDKSLILYSEGYGAGEEGDIAKTFLKEIDTPVCIYTRSPQDGRYMEILRLGGLDGVVIPIGIRTSVPGKYRLNFSGLSSFAPGYDIYLDDLSGAVPVSYNLRQGSIHEFEKEGDGVFDNRFTLSFVRRGTNSPAIVEDVTKLHAYLSHGLLEVYSNKEAIEGIGIYDLQGRLLGHTGKIETYHYRESFPHRGLYLVRIKTGSGMQTIKVVQ
ncbi:MAG: FG-GAP-like repeat-containing protein [Candidatus Azobacteroides sp.]|nr:FG-GAP-like repeat-containing protein [Candidatus Azobacteroides sp.]